MHTQICATCLMAKPVTEFWRQRNKRSGLMIECKSCAKARNVEWVRGNRERAREINARATKRKRQRHPVTGLLLAAKSRAKKFGIEFNLTHEDIHIPTHCPVLGIELVWNLGLGHGHKLAVRDHAPSLDRIDNARGYTRDNVAIVSYRANRIKSDATIAELRRLVEFYGPVMPGCGSETSASGLLPEANSWEWNIPLPGMQPSAPKEAS